MTNEEITAYLLNESRRKTINWTGMEREYGISKGRIKNVCLAKDVKSGFSKDEIEKLIKAISDLQTKKPQITEQRNTTF